MTCTNCSNPPSQTTDFAMHNLLDLYNNFGTMQIQGVDYFFDGWEATNCPNLYLQKKWIYEILGRMCHLLGDMSVPAHVHSNSHACSSGMYCDLYENNELNLHLWTADEIFAQNQTYINSFSQIWSDPIYYLMYYMNQITDHFASGKTDGNDNYDTNCPGLSSIIPTLGMPKTISQVNMTNITSMHDVLLPTVIRATAGDQSQL